MKKKIHIKSPSEIFTDLQYNNTTQKNINCINLTSSSVMNHLNEPILLKASIAILVLSGTASLSINYKTYQLFPSRLILLSASHLFNFENCSSDFECIFLFVTRDFTDEMDSTDMVYKRIRYEVITFRNPTIQISKTESCSLERRLKNLGEALENEGHLYYKEVILNALIAFYLDLSHIIDQQKELFERTGETRQEYIMKKFIELLALYYHQEHKVDFYATRLNLSSHYLTLVVKRITGQSVSDFIFEMLYSEARNLLTNSKLSIQEISMKLNFSDQSAFGKFFKRRSGISAANYRKKGIETITNLAL